MATWLDFWNTSHRLYVNDRHRDVHYRRIADDVARFIPESAAAKVIDFGPGEALHADRVADRCARLILCEAADETRRHLETRFAGHPKIVVSRTLDEEPDGSIDLFVVNSVVQYLSPEEFGTLLALARRVLSDTGRLVIADVIPPEAGMVGDTTALLTFAARERFLGAAALGLAATAFSPYARLRSQLGLTKFSETDMLARLGEAGFAAERHRPNPGHNQGRMAFVARKS